MDTSANVLVIGAGASGLAAIKCCLDEGLSVVCFERSSEFGGMWNYRDVSQSGIGGTYKSCTINTSKEMMAYSDYPIPREYPVFLPHRLVFKYFQSYSSHFQLEKHIKYCVDVQSVKRSPCHQTTGKWKVIYSIAGAKEPAASLTATFDYIMVCTGHHVFPNIPQFPGMDRFTGTIIHSRDFKVPEECRDKKVVVVGMGNSGVDIAVDISRNSNQTYLSTRRGAWIIGRMGPLGLPTDALANNRFLFTLPQSLLQASVEIMANFKFNHTTYGVKPQHRALEAHPTVNDDLPLRIMTGAIKIKPNISHFTENGLTFEDGTYVEADVVIMATGYLYKHPFLDKNDVPVQDNESSLFKFVFPPKASHQTLAMIGLVQAIGAVIPVAEMQCRWATRVFNGKCKLPPHDVMRAEIHRRKAKNSRQYLKSKRHNLQTFWIEYMDSVAKEIDVRPNLLKIAKRDPVLALKCFFGPCVPAQYRLEGPGSWKGARDIILNSITNSMAGLNTAPDIRENAVSNRWPSDLQTVVWVVLVMLVMYYIGIYDA